MAMTNREPSSPLMPPSWPDPDDMVDRVALEYDPELDTLFVFFAGHSRPAINVPLDTPERDYIYLRIDPNSNEAVGIEIEDFLTVAVRHFPAWLDLAELAGVEPEMVAAIRRELPPAARRRAALGGLAADVQRLAT